jgi:polyisoprenyl-phosphate glycosyltransferase
VNDGSLDSTREILRQLNAGDPRVKVVSLSRNFGHQIAVMAGLSHAAGDCVAVMDGDLQDPPQVIEKMLEKWREGFRVVYGVRRKRKENYLKIKCYHYFYIVWQKITGLKIPLDAGDFCLLDRRVVRELLRFNEDQPFVRGFRHWVGFKHTGVEYERQARSRGVSKYSILGLFKLAADGILSFSPSLLRLSIGIGLALSLASLSYAFIVLADRILMGLGVHAAAHLIPGWATMVFGLLFLFGMQFIFMGVLGEYIGRIFIQTKQRPLYIVEETLGFKKE